MALMGVAFAPWAFVSERGARVATKLYCRWVIWSLAKICHLHTEVRGVPPSTPVLIAAKHQSFLDIILIYNALPHGFFIMKNILSYAPFLGPYALKIGCVPVKRGKRGAAIAKMLNDVETGKAKEGQLIIYPQGTRVAPGENRPYKIGTAALYQQMRQPCVPVATNVGVFWPKRGILRKPGVAVVQFMDPLPPGQDKDRFMDTLETRIETQSNHLMREAGFSL